MAETILKRYSELILLPTFKERYEYLKLGGIIGSETFGFDRYLNQSFYKTKEWESIRNYIIVRDNGCDLGVPGMEIRGKIIVHHVNPISMDDIVKHSDWILDPEFLISTSMDTHNAIHYGSEDIVACKTFVERTPNDTTLWRTNHG